MTIQEFHNNIDIELDKTLDFEYPYILPEQKDYWLNKAQDRFIKDKLYPQDTNKKGFEESQQRIDQLRTLIKESAELTPVSALTKYTINLPNDYLYLVRHRCTTTDSTCGTKQVGGILAKQEYINEMLINPFWKPSAEEPLYYFLNNNIIYESLGNYILNNSLLTYIKTPLKITYGTQYSIPVTDIECELPVHTHQDLLNITVSMLLENIESQRYQTNLNELTK